MNNPAVMTAWQSFLESKLDTMYDWVDEFDRQLQGMGPEYELDETGVQDLLQDIEMLIADMEQAVDRL
ncbi:MAG: hypothetical protein LC687_02565 [Actinobacteria bacterium]|nr:hypothetical protein [Actinomycetota bacterium]MCA1806735.1 hypothetical protein [Actinomycetota bacterium]